MYRKMHIQPFKCLLKLVSLRDGANQVVSTEETNTSAKWILKTDKYFNAENPIRDL
jgi:hypothetical protein